MVLSNEACNLFLTLPDDYLVVMQTRLSPSQRLQLSVQNEFGPGLELNPFNGTVHRLEVKIRSQSCGLLLELPGEDGAADSPALEFPLPRGLADLAVVARGVRKFLREAQLINFVVDVGDQPQGVDSILDLVLAPGGVSTRTLRVAGETLSTMAVAGTLAIPRVKVDADCRAFSAADLQGMRQAVQDRRCSLASFHADVHRDIALDFLRGAMALTMTEIRRDPGNGRGPIGLFDFTWPHGLNHEFYVGVEYGSALPLNDILHFHMGVYSSVHFKSEGRFIIHFERCGPAPPAFIVNDFVRMMRGGIYFLRL